MLSIATLGEMSSLLVRSRAMLKSSVRSWDWSLQSFSVLLPSVTASPGAPLPLARLNVRRAGKLDSPEGCVPVFGCQCHKGARWCVTALTRGGVTGDGGGPFSTRRSPPAYNHPRHWGSSFSASTLWRLFYAWWNLYRRIAFTSLYHHHYHHHHHHQSLNREGRWGTTNNFATSFLHFSLFSTALWDLPNSWPVYSLMLSSHLFLCLPCLFYPFTVPCVMVSARPDEWETWPYHCRLRLFTIVRSSCGPITR